MARILIEVWFISYLHRCIGHGKPFETSRYIGGGSW